LSAVIARETSVQVTRLPRRWYALLRRSSAWFQTHEAAPNQRVSCARCAADGYTRMR
jgi:hypothetical protein